MTFVPAKPVSIRSTSRMADQGTRLGDLLGEIGRDRKALLRTLDKECAINVAVTTLGEKAIAAPESAAEFVEIIRGKLLNKDSQRLVFLGIGLVKTRTKRKMAAIKPATINRPTSGGSCVSDAPSMLKVTIPSDGLRHHKSQRFLEAKFSQTPLPA